jgi:hypothetical protein
MSIAELKQTADRLTAKERAWLRAYLFAHERASDPSWKAEMATRRHRLAAGKGVTSSAYRRGMRSVSAKAPTASAK